MIDYQEYIKSNEWRERAILAKDKADHHCALCGLHTRALEVHHNNYDRLGDERDSDLIVLCRDCHRRHHGVLLGPRHRCDPQLQQMLPFVPTIPSKMDMS